MIRSIKSKFNRVDDGFGAELVRNAKFDGLLEMPTIEMESEIKIPDILVPYSKLERCKKTNKFCCFYEMDVNFSRAIADPGDDKVVEKLKGCAGIITPDCSVCINAPLCVQVMSIYRSRAVGAYWQSLGFYTIVNVRWGDKRTFTKEVLPEPIAFLGVPKNSIVSIGTYGAMRNLETKKCFRDGLVAMLDYLHPRTVLVYGVMLKDVFGDLTGRTRFVRFDDWTKLCHRGVS